MDTCQTTPNERIDALIQHLNSGQVAWRSLSQADRRSVICAIIDSLDDRPTLDSVSAGRVWLPKNLSQTMTRLGLSWRNLKDQEGTPWRCDCGVPAEHYPSIEILSPRGSAKRCKLPLCESCYAEFIELEATRGRH